MVTATSSTEVTKFEALVKSITRQIRALAASSDGEQQTILNQAANRAIDRAYDLTRFQADPGAAIARVEGLFAARRFAAKQSTQNVREARYAELARLNEAIRVQRVEQRITCGY